MKYLVKRIFPPTQKSSPTLAGGGTWSYQIEVPYNCRIVRYGLYGGIQQVLVSQVFPEVGRICVMKTENILVANTGMSDTIPWPPQHMRFSTTMGGAGGVLTILLEYYYYSEVNSCGKP